MTTPENIYLRREFIRNHPDCVSGAAYDAGKKAAVDGRPMAACPWIEGSPEAADWRNGWYGMKSKFSGYWSAS